MTRFRLPIFACVAVLAAAAPATAGATILELGSTTTPLAAPTCPSGTSASSCTIILTRVTALETLRDGVAYPTTVTRAGYLFAFTLGLSRLSSSAATAKSDVHYLNSTYGGTTQAGITVLKPVGPKNQRRWSVVGRSAIYHLQPYLGEVVQFPLTTPIAVKPGEVVALTVPTWAPVLTFGLAAKKFAYRQSRGTNCSTPSSANNAQRNIGTTVPYVCNYPGTRVEYSATEVTSPVPPKNQIKAPLRLRKS